VGLTRRGTRFVSDSLKFTGTDLGDRRSGLARRTPQGHDDDTESEEDDEDDYDLALLTPEQKEEALVQTAMARIERAHDDRPDSPFQYEYVQRPSSSAGRHVSDVMPRPLSSRGHQYDDGSSTSLNSASRNQLDPFMFQTAGPRAPYPGGAAPGSRRHVSGPADGLYMSRREEGRSSRNSRRSVYGESSEESEPSESASDELNNGARIREPARGGRSEIVVQPDPEPEVAPKKKSSESSKRKPVPSSSSGRGGRRKKK